MWPRLLNKYTIRLESLQQAKRAAIKAAEKLRAAEQADCKLQALKQRSLEADQHEVLVLENALSLAYQLEEKVNTSSK